MKMTTTFAAVAMCASLYLTTGPAQADLPRNGLTLNGLHINGIFFNGLLFNGLTSNGVLLNGLAPNRVISNGGVSNGIVLNGTALNDGPTPEVQRESLPFNGLSQKGLGKTHP